MNANKRYFTVQEAQNILPKTRKLVMELQELQQALELLDTVEIEVDEDYAENGQFVTQFNKSFHKLSYKFYDKLQQLEYSGVMLKDLEQGLVDFYARFEDREIFLCWKLGENRVIHWHEIEEGFLGRRKIMDLDMIKK